MIVERDPESEAALPEEGFEVIAAVTEPVDPDLVRRLEDAGVTGLVSYPLLYTIGPGTTLEQKRAALEQYGGGIIARC